MKLPKKLILTDEVIYKNMGEAIADGINEYLSDKYGYCNNGFSYNIKIEVDNIDGDIKE